MTVVFLHVLPLTCSGACFIFSLETRREWIWCLWVRTEGHLSFRRPTVANSSVFQFGSNQNELPNSRHVNCFLDCFPANLMFSELRDTRHTVVANNAAPHWLSANLPLWEAIGQAICSIGGIKSEIKPPAKCVGACIFFLFLELLLRRLFLLLC